MAFAVWAGAVVSFSLPPDTACSLDHLHSASSAYGRLRRTRALTASFTLSGSSAQAWITATSCRSTSPTVPHGVPPAFETGLFPGESSDSSAPLGGTSEGCTTSQVVAAFRVKGRFSLDVEGLCGAVPVGATGCCAICWTALVVLLSLVIKGVVD